MVAWCRMFRSGKEASHLQSILDLFLWSNIRVITLGPLGDGHLPSPNTGHQNPTPFLPWHARSFLPILYWLVVSTPLKNISHLGWLFPIYGKIKNGPNHQPVYYCIPKMGPAMWQFVRSSSMVSLVVATPLSSCTVHLSDLLGFFKDFKAWQCIVGCSQKSPWWQPKAGLQSTKKKTQEIMTSVVAFTSQCFSQSNSIWLVV